MEKKLASFKNRLGRILHDVKPLSQQKEDLWAKNLFTDLTKLGGQLIVMRTR